ncbi:Hypp2368 [Branchiostoma lanceolatum]|uniref:Hypp2368 protein n=1 Tax=Branchiostoma lanceolatum TaxID=7740 RepID=A0A8J9ZQ46_BRALA|nr:Hypp2368 [Branchiostoma lanceolatum]
MPAKSDGLKFISEKMASFGKLFSRCLALSSQVLPTTRRLHMAAGPGWDVITGLGKLARQLPAEDPPSPARTAVAGVSLNSVILQAAMEDTEALNTHHPSAAALRLLEHADAFSSPDPGAANLRLKIQVSRQYGLPTSVWSFRNGKLVNTN